MTNSKRKIAEIYKGFVITHTDDSNIYAVAYSDIRNIAGLDAVKAEIDRNLELANAKTEVATYRGVPIIRRWQNVEVIVRNGEDMVDNGFYYQIPIHPFSGTLHTTLDNIRLSIDRTIADNDDFHKNQFPVEYRKFMKLVSC
ncbi:hypothetical protein [Draconibacterium orientale]|uniref:hypothetical protein n=1 Tax=Draconibacterium orientale TaxID=1168034 RepID=UPI0029C07117|nr:hypothetical protein [Draconibacterium orientale]